MPRAGQATCRPCRAAAAMQGRTKLTAEQESPLSPHAPRRAGDLPPVPGSSRKSKKNKTNGRARNPRLTPCPTPGRRPAARAGQQPQVKEEQTQQQSKTASDEALQTHSQDMQRGLKIDFSHRFSALSASQPDAPASALQPRIPLTGNAIPLIARLAIQLLRFGRIIRYALGIFVENTE